MLLQASGAYRNSPTSFQTPATASRIRIVRQRQSRRQHRTGPRVACRPAPLETGRDVRERSSRRTPRAAASAPLLRRPHGHHRDLRRRLPAETPPRARYGSDQDRHLMMPSPPIHQPSDARHSGWLSAGTAPAYCSSINRPAVAPPTLSDNARYPRSARHSHPSCAAERLRRSL